MKKTKKVKKAKRLFDPKTRLYWIKKVGKYYDIGAKDFNVVDCGYTIQDAKEMFLEKMIILYGDLLDKLKEIHFAYSQAGVVEYEPELSDLDDMEVEPI